MRLRARAFLALAIAAALFGISAGGPFPSLAGYLAAGTLLLSGLWTWALRRGLTVTVSATGRTFTVGDQAEMALRIENDSLFPVPWLEVRDGSGTGLESAEPEVLAAWPYSERRRSRTLTLQRRGRYRAGPVEVAFGDPFGLFEVRRLIEGRERFVVYPEPAPVTHLPLRYRQPFGRVPTRLRAHQDPTSLADVRPMVPGDSPRFIHWKASARQGVLHVKEFELRATTDVMVVLDMQREVQAGEGSRRTDETAASLALGIFRHAVRQDLPVGLLASGSRRVRVAPGRGERHFRELRERLVDVQADGEAPLAAWLARERPALLPASSLVIITPRLDRSLAAVLLQIRRGGSDIVLLHLLPETFSAQERPEPMRSRLWETLGAAGVAVLRLGADGRGWEALQEPGLKSHAP